MSPVAHESDSAMGSSEGLFSRCGEKKRLHSLVHKYKTIYVLYTTFQKNAVILFRCCQRKSDSTNSFHS